MSNNQTLPIATLRRVADLIEVGGVGPEVRRIIDRELLCPHGPNGTTPGQMGAIHQAQTDPTIGPECVALLKLLPKMMGYRPIQDGAVERLRLLVDRLAPEQQQQAGGEDNSLHPMTQKQLAEAIQCGVGTIRGWADEAGVPRRQQQGDEYTRDEVVRILRIGAKKRSAYGRAARELLGQ